LPAKHPKKTGRKKKGHLPGGKKGGGTRLKATGREKGGGAPLTIRPKRSAKGLKKRAQRKRRSPSCKRGTRKERGGGGPLKKGEKKRKKAIHNAPLGAEKAVGGKGLFSRKKERKEKKESHMGKPTALASQPAKKRREKGPAKRKAGYCPQLFNRETDGGKSDKRKAHLANFGKSRKRSCQSLRGIASGPPTEINQARAPSKAFKREKEKVIHSLGGKPRKKHSPGKVTTRGGYKRSSPEREGKKKVFLAKGGTGERIRDQL